MTMRATWAARNMRMACGVSVRNSSASSKAPIGRPSTATNTTERRPPRGTPDSPQRPFLRLAVPVNHSREPAHHLPSIDDAGKPEPMVSRTSRGIGSGRPRSARGLQRSRRRARDARLARATRQAAAPRRRVSPGAARRKQARAADRQRAGLVEQHGVRSRQRLERPAALDQDAAPRRLRDAGDEGDRRRQNKRTGRRRHQHGETANQIARDQPGEQRR